VQARHKKIEKNRIYKKRIIAVIVVANYIDVNIFGCVVPLLRVPEL
jgi:hypothetical protein